MREIIECVPNFSTSDPEVVQVILKEIEGTEDAYLLDHTYDDYYNRLVVTFVGDQDSIVSGALRASKKGIRLIDMTGHQGQHPRMGAVDVVPFVPLRDVELEDCIRVSKEFGRRLAEECDVPVYLYAEAATSAERRDLDWIRKGEYEELAHMMRRPGREPDFGPASPHPTAGATVTGARQIMVGFNVNLGTSDLRVAKKIARALHAKKGGLAFVKAMAAEIPERGMTQIGMSITDFKKTPIHRVLELLKVEAQRYNVPIVGSEFCGLTPLRALVDVAHHYLRVDNLTEDRVIEIAVQHAMENG